MRDDESSTSEDLLDEPESAGFAPADLWDDRHPLDWKSRYDADAWKGIRNETLYCFLLFLAAPVLMLALWAGRETLPWVSAADSQVVCKYLFAWLGGLFGGVLFDVKWLYHAVAKQMWHEDRRLWRLLMPHLSGGLAFAVVMVMSSGMFAVFDRDALLSPSVSVAIGFLVGYFSDNAIGKLSEIAGTLFGTTESHGSMSRRK